VEHRLSMSTRQTTERCRMLSIASW